MIPGMGVVSRILNGSKKVIEDVHDMRTAYLEALLEGVGNGASVFEIRLYGIDKEFDCSSNIADRYNRSLNFGGTIKIIYAPGSLPRRIVEVIDAHRGKIGRQLCLATSEEIQASFRIVGERLMVDYEDGKRKLYVNYYTETEKAAAKFDRIISKLRTPAEYRN